MPRCMACQTPVAGYHKQLNMIKKQDSTKNAADILDSLGVMRYCCRAAIMCEVRYPYPNVKVRAKEQQQTVSSIFSNDEIKLFESTKFEYPSIPGRPTINLPQGMLHPIFLLSNGVTITRIIGDTYICE